MSERIEALRRQILQIDELAASGALKAPEAASTRARLERELLEAVVQGGAPSAAAQTGAPVEARPSAKLTWGLTGFVLVFGVVFYAWLGNLAGWSVSPGQPGSSQAAGGGEAAHTMDMGQFEAMAAKLAERLKTQPDDAEGWAMLGRSYTVLQRHAEAAPAYKKVVELRPRDAQALADYADALGMANGRTLEGEPTRLIEQALKLDPANLKALSLAGTVSFQKGDFAGAVALWERGVKAGEPGSELVRNLQAGIEEARQRGNLVAQAAGSASAPPVRTPPDKPTNGQAQGEPHVRGRVSLSPALKGQVAPQDTVFVFARAAEGPRVPLAILRAQVKDLPLDFKLDDSLAMSPAAKLSRASQVIVGARISKSGNAMPQPGDLQGLSAPVKVGTEGLVIEISDPVK